MNDEQNYVIGQMSFADWEQVREIYVEGIQTGNSTFEYEPPTWEKWHAGHLDVCRLVAKVQNEVCGWAALSPTSSRAVYAGVTEVSIYVSSKYRGMGIGSALLENLVKESEQHGIWTLQAGIFPENTASLNLHKKFGFRKVGLREHLGKMKDGNWRDVVLLERRSRLAGISV